VTPASAQDASARSSGSLALNSAGSGVSTEAQEVGEQVTARDLNRQATIKVRAGHGPGQQAHDPGALPLRTEGAAPRQETDLPKSPAPALALAKIDLEEKSVEGRLRLKGKAAVDLIDYQRAYQALNGAAIEADPLVAHILATFIEADRGFQSWRKAMPRPGVR
jgi:hypothetical protein